MATMYGPTLYVPRRLPVGAELVAEGGAHFRLWAPKAHAVELVHWENRVSMEPEPGGYFSAFLAGARAGDQYRFSVDGGEPLPDPASRFQPQGPHGPSELVDPQAFVWTDGAWRGPQADRQIIYELHIGTFTPEATWRAAADRLPHLAALGVTTVQVMPVAEFPGAFGWGYDGVNLFAPYHGYGACNDFRAFVDRAHALGLAVILDVVYNHFGPDGNYLPRFSDAYFSATHHTEWGQAINFDGTDAEPVREFVLANVRHWIAEYHLDGLRLDATHSIYDDSDIHITRDIADAAREAAGERSVVVIAENEPQDPRLVRAPEVEGHGLDQVWADDFHHLATVAATGRREAYFTDYHGSAQEFVSIVKHGILYQGQRYRWQKKRRGSPAMDVDPWRWVIYLGNHDQVANSRYGRRLHQLTSPGRYRALTALLLLAPQTPLLFQGQEFGSTSPFLYFADHNPELAHLVRKGRAEFLSQFASIADSNGGATLDDPGSWATFEQSRLNPRECQPEGPHYALHRDLIALRRQDRVISLRPAAVDGAVLSPHAFVIRFFSGDVADRLLVVNLGPDLELDIVPEPLLAPQDAARGWRRLWYSEDPAYGGLGAPPPESPDGAWKIVAESATLLAADWNTP